MRKYKWELPQVCCAERVVCVVFFLFLCPFFFHVGLLHRSHSPRQFACLSESERRGLSALTPHPGCAQYPNGPVLAFKSRAPTFPLTILPSTRAPFCRPHPFPPVNTPALLGEKGRKREGESSGHYLMRSRSAGVCLLSQSKQRHPLCRWGESTGLIFIFLLFLCGCVCRLRLNNHHFTETTRAPTGCFFLSGNNRRCIKSRAVWRLFLLAGAVCCRTRASHQTISLVERAELLCNCICCDLTRPFTCSGRYNEVITAEPFPTGHQRLIVHMIKLKLWAKCHSCYQVWVSWHRSQQQFLIPILRQSQSCNSALYFEVPSE